MEGEILVDAQDSIAVLTFSRPDKLNAVTRPMLDSFSEKVSLLINDPDIIGLIITGEGDKAFTAGFDLDMMNSLEGDEPTEFFKHLEKIMYVLSGSRNCVTLAAVNGYAVGFGAMVASACDFRFFSENGVFRLIEIDLGIFPGSGAASNLIRLVGPSRAKELLMTARSVTAHEASKIGLADRVYPQGELMERSLEFMKELAQKDRKLLTRVKNLVDAMTGQDMESATDLEAVYTDEWLREFRR
ncbi:MAG: enoyl-CoA hydratase/isomerase family protein [Candidatus Thorarchaeota archaeon]|nr:MAG: enoyl-CoA hydratase/isomerase family protein [Candidatus Thorarchaeota archaeon]